MTLKELQLRLSTLILEERLSGDEQVAMPDICTQGDPVDGKELEPVSGAGVITFHDGTKAVMLINTSRAAAIMLREKLTRKG